MKKLFLLILLFPIAAFAKFYPGKVMMTDGSAKTGLIEIPKFNANKLVFKAGKDAKAEKIEIDAVEGFEVTNEKRELSKFIALKLAMPKLMKDGFNIDEDKSWVRLEKEGTFNIVSTYSYVGKIAGASGSSGSEEVNWFIWFPENDYGTYVYKSIGGGLNFQMNAYSALEYGIRKNFENSCPNMMNALNKDDVKKNGLFRIIELYDQNCK